MLTEGLSKAVTVAVIGPEGILQVFDLSWKDRAVWKFPGGRVDYGETPQAAAVRELYEETGFMISEEVLVLLHTEKRTFSEPHMHYFFGVQIEGTFESQGLERFGPVTGEQTRLIPTDTLFEDLQTLLTQRRILERLQGESQK